jgi:polysaccharide pyruvyl transferase WcaK-like protein
MNRPRHLLFVGDVGGPATYHVGDEAMLEANLDGFRARLPGLRATVVSRDPAWSATHFGAEAVGYIGFPAADRAGDDEREALLDRLLAGIDGDHTDAWGRDAIRAVAESDGVVISGGGNLSASWPEHVYERAALGEIARRLGKPVVLLGQTIGPEVSPPLRPLLARLLRTAALVGVRELPSAALALALGAPAERLLYQTDDALFLEAVPVAEPWAGELVNGRPWIAVTLDPHAAGDAALGSLADQLARLATSTGARLVFLPHVAGDGGDDNAGHALAARLPAATPLFIAPVLEARQARWLTGQADLIVSSRYHPLVFGLADGRPCVGMVTDEYRRVKLRGALAHAGLEECCLSRAGALGGGLFETASDLWSRREAIGRQLAATRASWHAAEDARWHRVLSALGLCGPDGTGAEAALGYDPVRLSRLLLGELDARREFAAEVATAEASRRADIERHAIALESRRGEAERYALSLCEEVDKLRAVRSEAERYALSLRDELTKVQQAYDELIRPKAA